MCNQVFAYSAGATCGQVQVVGIIALTVGMTADPDRDFRVAAERAGRGDGNLIILICVSGLCDA